MEVQGGGNLSSRFNITRSNNLAFLHRRAGGAHLKQFVPPSPTHRDFCLKFGPKNNIKISITIEIFITTDFALPMKKIPGRKQVMSDFEFSGQVITMTRIQFHYTNWKYNKSDALDGTWCIFYGLQDKTFLLGPVHTYPDNYYLILSEESLIG